MMANLQYAAEIIMGWVEVWLCYRLLFATTIDEKHLHRAGRIAIWINILILGSLIGVNHRLVLFSSTMFLFEMIVTCIFVCAIMRRKIILNFFFIIAYYTIVSLLDFTLAFFCMLIFKEDFKAVVFLHSKSFVQILLLLISRLIMWGVIDTVRRNQKIVRQMEKYQFLLLAIANVLIVLLFGNQLLLVEMMLGEREMYPARAGITLLLAVVIVLLSEFVFLKNRVIESENEYLLLKDQMAEDIYLQMEVTDERTRQFKHDFQKYLSIIQKYEEDKDFEGLHFYLQELGQEFSKVSTSVWTGNKLLDFLISQKKQQADESGIQFVIETTAIGQLPFTTSEICSLFGNILDNAIEACERMENGEPWIKIRLKQQSGLFFVEVANSIDRIPRRVGDDWKTSKEDQKMHGYGLKCVRRIVEKYEGVLEYQVDAEEFRIDITFFNVLR